jgi:hypothetical protein
MESSQKRLNAPLAEDEESERGDDLPGKRKRKVEALLGARCDVRSHGRSLDARDKGNGTRSHASFLHVETGEDDDKGKEEDKGEDKMWMERLYGMESK